MSRESSLCAMAGTLVLGTQNQDKIKELKVILKGCGIRVLSLSNFKRCPDVIENRRTFEANARKKARDYSKHTGCLVLADDSGIVVDALSGKPGVYSARFAGPGCTYHDNNLKLLRLLKEVPPAKRRAKFVCVMALCDRGKFIGSVKGECRGRIASQEKGVNGFGYDPVFIPDGFKRTFAGLSPNTKNKISHRGRALRSAKRIIRRYFKKRKESARQ